LKFGIRPLRVVATHKEATKPSDRVAEFENEKSSSREFENGIFSFWFRVAPFPAPHSPLPTLRRNGELQKSSHVYLTFRHRIWYIYVRLLKGKI
jgi:hypothetical protein